MKRILFVIDSLNIGGAEKSLVSLLNNIDFQVYEVDLQLFGYGGGFEQYLPDQVHLLPPLPLSRFLDKGFLAQFLHFNFKYFVSRLAYSLRIRTGNLNHTDKARIYWQCFANQIDIFPQLYDVAIAYAHNIPTFYVADKTIAKKKIAWVNAEIHFSDINKEFQTPYYNKFDNIVLVSEQALLVFRQQFAKYSDQLIVIKDIVDLNFISKLSKKSTDEILNDSLPCLLTVARLEKFHKGYDITMETCKLLKERGLRFCWYVIGEGEYRPEMEEYIKNNSLQDCFLLLGKKANPYPYFRKASIYVQTSRREGFGLSIAEARLLNCPVVTTEFGAVWDQMVQGENGLVVPMKPDAIADAIEQLLNDKELYNHIVAYQRREKKGNIEEIENFYRLIN
jgi:glycosyltransferase involved in cell wall biosynthesis